MKRNSGHQSKNRWERSAYVDYIKQQNYEPTKEEGLNFNDSQNKETDYSIQKSPNKRKRQFSDIMKEHFSENWPNYLAGSFTFILLFLTVDSKIDIATIVEKLNGTSTNIESIKEDQKELLKSNHEQDLKIQENKLNLEHLQKSKTEKTVPNNK